MDTEIVGRGKTYSQKVQSVFCSRLQLAMLAVKVCTQTTFYKHIKL